MFSEFIFHKSSVTLKSMSQVNTRNRTKMVNFTPLVLYIFSVIDGLIDAFLLSNKQNFSYCTPLALLCFALKI